jgi:hypothetical protein
LLAAHAHGASSPRARARTQVPPVLNQFVTRALDKNQAETLFKLLLKYRCVVFCKLHNNCCVCICRLCRWRVGLQHQPGRKRVPHAVPSQLACVLKHHAT